MQVTTAPPHCSHAGLLLPIARPQPASATHRCRRHRRRGSPTRIPGSPASVCSPPVIPPLQCTLLLLQPPAESCRRRCRRREPGRERAQSPAVGTQLAPAARQNRLTMCRTGCPTRCCWLGAAPLGPRMARALPRGAAPRFGQRLKRVGVRERRGVAMAVDTCRAIVSMLAWGVLCGGALLGQAAPTCQAGQSRGSSTAQPELQQSSCVLWHAPSHRTNWKKIS